MISQTCLLGTVRKSAPDADVFFLSLRLRYSLAVRCKTGGLFFGVVIVGNGISRLFLY